MKLGSLFDGSGTCPLAATAVGIRPAWASEIEPFPKAVTESRFPNMVHLGDITRLDGGKIEPVDVITFGSPCQNLSTAGNREGLAGEESSLFLEAVRTIKEMRIATDGKYPQIAMWENVTGAFSSNKGGDFQRVVEELCKICDPDADVPRPPNGRWGKAGLYMGDHYSLAWRQLDAQHWGVAQRRKRIFAVLDLGGQCAGEILFKREGLRMDFKKVRRKGQAASSRVETSPAEHDCLYALENHPNDRRIAVRQDGVVQTLTARMGTGGGNVPLILTSIAFEQQAYDTFKESDTASTLKASGGSYGGGTEVLISAEFMISPSGKAQGIGYEEEMSPTLLVSGPHGVLTHYSVESCHGRGKDAVTEDGILYLVRKLTPTECASLQGFEKDWCALVEHKDAPEYKMWGNGMAFPCVLYVMEGIAEVLQRRYLESLFGGSPDG